ncbi:two-component system, NarL family, capsular synthesis sensor histidine kinase RcsC [Pseudomonas cuatrocienegasensis]|uniref:histidine kinase n=1 Tax=Pseudomonas cuatrocienegasensis TaxID=543360 RepID=A0ABY1BPI8_9PSED|nr:MULTISPECIES: hybrid sensor histidine kinase/response regulator [Pseudomonas]OEC33754.1 hypothetical protein A7D25_17360 [Pseudomonas sp. 21C1]SER31760.1 two-component system, NarL family, capsular synthesis sensor histidine kinase RcsC [Pseudomonas cuatrocienegasensis]
MKHDTRPIGELALSSVRQNRGLLLLSAFSLACTALMTWGMARLLEEENNKVNYHFARLMADVHEHETFLRNIALRYREALPPESDIPLAVKLDAQAGDAERAVYQGQQFVVSLPFTLAFNKRYSLADMRAPIALAVRLADYYGTYWANAEYTAPQVLLFSPENQFSIALPAAGYPAMARPLAPENYLPLSDGIYQRLVAQQAALSEPQVLWEKISPAGSDRLIASIGINLAGTTLPSPSESVQGILTSRLDMDQIEDVQRILERSIYDSFTLISPGGKVLLGRADGKEQLPEGLNLGRDGINVRVTTHQGPAWTGIYVIHYATFLRVAKWPIVALALTLLGFFACTWLANRWYRSRVVLPAQHAHQSLVESQTFIRDVIDASPTGLSLIRRNDRHVFLKNQSAQQWGGTTQLLDLIENQPESAELCMKVGERYLQAFFVRSRYRGDDVLLCAFIDITQHHADNTALAEAKKNADHASEAKTLFLATMSHELRTPLYGVLGNLELLGLTDLNPRQRAYLQTIQSSSASLSGLIRDVLDVSKIEAGQIALEPVPFSPRELATTCLAAIRAHASAKGLQLDIEIDEHLPARLLGDPMRLQQIIANLLNNALKFTEVGRISLRLSVIEQQDEHATLCWQVVDTGIGISRAQQAWLFKPFYQVPGSSQRTGAGLGLSICASLSELMGGRLRVVSEPGLGSKFSLELAMKIMPEAQDSAGTATNPAQPIHLRILVAEDNPINRAILQEQLSALGARVETVCDGAQALQRWQPDAFDLIITDVNMPVVNGYELARQLRERGATLPIIGVTANALREEGQRCLSMGMNAWIVKPLTLDSLHATLLKVCPDCQAAPQPVTAPPDGALTLSGFSAQMQALFVSTMATDIATARDALASADASRLIQYLHRMSGAYAAVGANEIAEQCFSLEAAISDQTLTAELANRTDILLHQLSAQLKV